MINMMIVEDELIERNALVYATEKHFKDKIELVAVVSNGQEAIDFEEENQVDLIIMDINMPIKNGIDASKIICKRNKDIIIIILTAYLEFEYARQALNIGVFKYLSKPIAEDDFVSSINEAIIKCQKQARQARIIEKNNSEWIERNRNEKHIDEMKEYIFENYTKKINIEDVSKHVGLNPDYLGKLFKKVEGYTFTDYIIHLRMEKAKELLGNRQLTIKEISYMVGYSDPNYFSRAFKKYVGVSPNRYERGVIK